MFHTLLITTLLKLFKPEIKIIFTLHPTPIRQIIAVSDAGKTLPPKSTWVEPKLRSGLFIYDFGMNPHPTK